MYLLTVNEVERGPTQSVAMTSHGLVTGIGNNGGMDALAGLFFWTQAIHVLIHCSTSLYMSCQ